MNAALFAMPAEVPEWKHCAPYFLAAVALHLLALVWPRQTTVGELGLPPVNQIMVHLVDQPAAPPAVQSPPAPSEPSAVPAPPQRDRLPRTVRPILAMPAKSAPAPAAFVVPAAPAAPPELAPAASERNGPVAPPVSTPAQFNAAYLQNPAPVFPPLSRRQGEQGKVLLRVKVSAEGHPVAVDLEKSSNFVRLDEAARLAVSRWRFVPARRGEQAVEGSVIVPIVFRLED